MSVNWVSIILILSPPALSASAQDDRAAEPSTTAGQLPLVEQAMAVVITGNDSFSEATRELSARVAKSARFNLGGWRYSPRFETGYPRQPKASLDRQEVAPVVKSNLPKLRACYVNELYRNPTLAGRVSVAFVIASDGLVAGAIISSTTLNNAPVEICLIGVFHQIRFPRPRGGGTVEVSFPLVFSTPVRARRR